MGLLARLGQLARFRTHTVSYLHMNNMSLAILLVDVCCVELVGAISRSNASEEGRNFNIARLQKRKTPAVRFEHILLS